MSARFICSAAELRPCRITSVVIGSASAEPSDNPWPARYTRISPGAIAVTSASFPIASMAVHPATACGADLEHHVRLVLVRDERRGRAEQRERVQVAGACIAEAVPAL